MTIEAELETAANLYDLLAAIRAIPEDVYLDVDLTSLPTFGGEEPSSTAGVWSWDEEHLLVGTCRDDFRIVPRTEHCIYCARECSAPPKGFVEGTQAWLEKTAHEHAANCEWVLTRAHTRETSHHP